MKSSIQSKIVFIYAIFFFQFGVVQAQKNFVQARIFKPNGDSISGFINYKGLKNNPIKISFKTNKTDLKSQVFLPLDLRGFEVNNEAYETSIVKKEVSPDRTYSLSYFKQFFFEEETFFPFQ